MKWVQIAFGLLAVLSATLANESVLAHGSGARSGGHRSGGFHGGARHFSGGTHFSGRHFSGSHAQLGIIVGAGGFWYDPFPYYYYPYPYPYSPAVVVPSSPPEYIEKGEEQVTPNPQAYWYFCPDSNTYYPYVKECPGGWQTVVPQPLPPS